MGKMKSSSRKPRLRSYKPVRRSKDDDIDDIQPIKPLLTWPGSKYRYLDCIPIPGKYNVYIEPFVGGGSMLFHLQPKRFIINDINKDLMNLYNVVRSDVKGLIAALKKFKTDKKAFLKYGNVINAKTRMTKLERAAIYLYLSKLSFNSHLNFRKDGGYILAYSNVCNKRVCHEENLTRMSKFLKGGLLLNIDYKKVLAKANKNDFVFLDPPYVTDTYKIYKDKWNDEDVGYDEHLAFFEQVKLLHKRGTKFVITYNYDKHLYKIYKDTGFHIDLVTKTHTIVPYILGQSYSEMIIYNFLKSRQ